MGKAKNLKSRVSSYFTGSSSLLEKINILVEKTKKIRIVQVTSEIESLLLEASYIKKYNPPYNSRLTDGKAYPLIRITVHDVYPAILVARRADDPKSLYFGPFPNAGDMKLVLRTIRRIFPYKSVQNHPKRKCLYWHLGLCPCPVVFDSSEAKRTYKNTIKHIITFLQGNIAKVVKELEKERKENAKKEEFEKARVVQNKIEAILKITTSLHTPFEYDSNPNLRSDIKEKEVSELLKSLQMGEVNVQNLSKIECYDISNIQGTNATGSLVVFVNGEKDKSQYRRFKIKFVEQRPNDFAMMQEVLTRRFKHTEWEFPDLLIIDGGKGQVSSALFVLKELGLNIPVIGLAKREELIITSDFKTIRLPRSSNALNLMRRIRDEAHRFAITYHRKLRSKSTFL